MTPRHTRRVGFAATALITWSVAVAEGDGLARQARIVVWRDDVRRGERCGEGAGARAQPVQARRIHCRRELVPVRRVGRLPEAGRWGSGLRCRTRAHFSAAARRCSHSISTSYTTRHRLPSTDQGGRTMSSRSIALRLSACRWSSAVSVASTAPFGLYTRGCVTPLTLAPPWQSQQSHEPYLHRREQVGGCPRHAMLGFGGGGAWRRAVHAVRSRQQGAGCRS